MTRRPFQALLLTLLAVTALSSGGCQWFRQMLNPRPQLIVDENPNFSQVANIVNQNSARVVSLQSNSARIGSSQMPATLNANLALRRDRRFRLKADFALSGTEVDLGSNDDLFWVWIRRGDPKALYFCRHDQFHQSNAQSILPVQTDWLIEAFGLTTFDPNQNYLGPEPVGRNRLRLTSLVQTPQGPMSKVTVVDARYGDVLEQHLYDGNQQLVASALTSDHRGYALQDNTQVYLPHEVQLEFPKTNMTLTISVSSYEINQIGADANLALWKMPNIPGYPLVDLADPNLRLTPIAGPFPATGQQQPGAQPSGAQQYGAQYGGVSPVSYPSGASQGFRPPGDTFPGANPSETSGGHTRDDWSSPVSDGGLSGSAFTSDSVGPVGSTLTGQSNHRETIVSPPQSYEPQRVLR
ncbi:MAG: hypothetical protein MPJ50_07300 [Pirellulales bacterium]|nr:hypothetical protein [Pirellulales bacterium]